MSAALRRKAEILKWLVTVPLAALTLLTVLLLGNIVMQGGRHADVVGIYYLPMFLYMWAIWSIRAALKAVAEGVLFDRIIGTLLFRVGAALFAGAAYTVVGRPLIGMFVAHAPGVSTFEPSAVTLGVVGAALMLFAQLFDRASALREEMEGFF